MAFRLNREESLSSNLHRLFRDELRRAERELRGANDDGRDLAVHNFRRHMKRVRSLLRLSRGMLGEQVYRRENARFRDAARELAAPRDAAVLLATLATLVGAEAAPVADSPAVSQLRQILDANYRETIHARLVDGDMLERVADEMATVLDTASGWPLGDNIDHLAVGLRRIYARGRREMYRALADPTFENYHSWRKRAKYLWHHVQVFEPTCPDLLGPSAVVLHDLSLALGDDHDLAVLQEALSRHATRVAGLPGLDEVAEAIASRQRTLRKRAHAYGDRVYAETPNAFARRMSAHWEAWNTGP